MAIRRAIAADIPAIMALEKSSATAAHYSEQQYCQIIDQGMKFHAANGPRGSGAKEGQNHVALVIEEHSQVEGFLVGHGLDAEWEIENIVVAEQTQKHGLGTALLTEFLKMARERGGLKICLEVRESNAAARRLYEKCQFAEAGRRRKYYRDPEEDAVLYVRQLE